MRRAVNMAASIRSEGGEEYRPNGGGHGGLKALTAPAGTVYASSKAQDWVSGRTAESQLICGQGIMNMNRRRS